MAKYPKNRKRGNKPEVITVDSESSDGIIDVDDDSRGATIKEPPMKRARPVVTGDATGSRVRRSLKVGDPLGTMGFAPDKVKNPPAFHKCVNAGLEKVWCFAVSIR